MSYNPSSRYQVVDHPPLPPSADLLTQGIIGPFIDTGYTIWFDATPDNTRIYYSKDTVREFADQLGLFDEFADAIEQAFMQGYDKGYREGLGENVDGPLDEFADRLELLLHLVRGGSLAPAVAPDPEPAPSDDGSDDAAASKQRQPRKTARKPRPADVSDAPGSEPALSL